MGRGRPGRLAAGLLAGRKKNMYALAYTGGPILVYAVIGLATTGAGSALITKARKLARR